MIGDIIFTIPGTFTGKQRPQTVTLRNGRSLTYTPKKTVNYETFVKLIYLENHFPNLQKSPFFMQVDIYYQIPKSYSKKLKEQCLKQQAEPIKKPDDDNIVKAISDALNGIAYYDDSQRTELIATKNWTDGPPFVVVLISKTKKIPRIQFNIKKGED